MKPKKMARRLRKLIRDARGADRFRYVLGLNLADFVVKHRKRIGVLR